MSTSDSQQDAAESRKPPAARAWTDTQWISERALDPAALARMANEFFTALPEFAPLGGVSQIAPAGVTLPGGADSFRADVAPGVAPAFPAVASVPSESELRALPPTLANQSGTSLIGQTGTNPSASLPTIPGDFVESISSSAPLFSFLSEARPIFGGTPWSALESQQTSVAFHELEKNPLGQPAPDVAPALSQVPAKSAPPVYGASVRPEAAERTSQYSFLNEARQLLPLQAAPILESEKPQADVLPGLSLSSRSFEVEEIRRDFPILRERVNGRPLIWFDNAATTQKPQAVIDRLDYFYTHENSNIHRAAHELAARATDAYEAAREKVRRFLNASSTREIIFVRGATEGINLVAQSWGRQNIEKGDEIVITWLEHHANIVPWQMLCSEKGARLRVAPVDDTGQVLLDEYTKLVGPRTRLVSIAHVSNALGTVTPVREMIETAHRHGAKVLVDGAQAVSHIPVDVQTLDCDFYVFSGHKVFAPTGIGAVYGKSDILEHTNPWQGGGSMIVDVTFEKTVYNVPPGRFEAGTGSIADAVGLGAAIDYVQRLGMANISRYEHDLLVYATEALLKIPGLRLIGTAKEKASVLSFVLDGFRTEDVGTALNREGIAVRAGHHCAQPIHRRFGLESSVRASLALYNTCDEVDALVAALWNLKQGHRSSLS
jgi:cysteine desulfurase/selenocysteine lyase